jgi:hypothetical protein
VSAQTKAPMANPASATRPARVANRVAVTSR